MKVHVVYDPVCDRHRVYFYQQDDTGTRWAREAERYGGRLIECPPGAELPVSLTLTSQEYVALQEAIHPAPEPANVDAVRDARTVRDRLLILIETVVLTDAHSPARSEP